MCGQLPRHQVANLCLVWPLLRSAIPSQRSHSMIAAVQRGSLDFYLDSSIATLVACMVACRAFPACWCWVRRGTQCHLESSKGAVYGAEGASYGPRCCGGDAERLTFPDYPEDLPRHYLLWCQCPETGLHEWGRRSTAQLCKGS